MHHKAYNTHSPLQPFNHASAHCAHVTHLNRKILKLSYSFTVAQFLRVSTPTRIVQGLNSIRDKLKAEFLDKFLLVAVSNGSPIKNRPGHHHSISTEDRWLPPHAQSGGKYDTDPFPHLSLQPRKWAHVTHLCRKKSELSYQFVLSQLLSVGITIRRVLGLSFIFTTIF